MLQVSCASDFKPHVLNRPVYKFAISKAQQVPPSREKVAPLPRGPLLTRTLALIVDPKRHSPGGHISCDCQLPGSKTDELAMELISPKIYHLIINRREAINTKVYRFFTPTPLSTHDLPTAIYALFACNLLVHDGNTLRREFLKNTSLRHDKHIMTNKVYHFRQLLFVPNYLSPA